ncbi:hypothetical protein B2J89_21085, partial [Acidovorax sp. SRB_24]|nr:hypothetical protein [Acidovorax sp. SRB_24]
APLEQAAERIGTLLLGKAPAGAPEAGASPGPEPLPSPYESNLSAWLLRRLRLATELAALMRADADQVLAALAPPAPQQGVALAVAENQKE